MIKHQQGVHRSTGMIPTRLHNVLGTLAVGHNQCQKTEWQRVTLKRSDGYNKLDRVSSPSFCCHLSLFLISLSLSLAPCLCRALTRLATHHIGYLHQIPSPLGTYK